MKQMRKALGGDKLDPVKALSLEGPFQREMGPRQMAGTHRADVAAARSACTAAKTPR